MISEGFKTILKYRINSVFVPVDFELITVDDTVIINVVSNFFSRTTEQERYSMIIHILTDTEKIFKKKYQYELGLYTPEELIERS